jgi:hypothetical protein
MVTITTKEQNGAHWYRVEYRLESVLVEVWESMDLHIAMKHVEKHARMDHALSRGKTFTMGKG